MLETSFHHLTEAFYRLNSFAEEVRIVFSKNRVALVTGSSSGIGSAVANAFASSGYNLVINYSSSAERAKETLANCEKLGSEVVKAIA